MAQINHGKCDMVSAEKGGVFAIKPNEQRAELIDPGKATFVRQALLVNLGVEQAFSSTLKGFTIAPVLGNVRDEAMIETDLARGVGVEGAIGVEKCASKGQSQLFHAFERRLEMGFQVERIVVMARDEPGGGENVPVRIRDGQDVTGLSALASLIGYTLAALLGNGMAAIQIQLAQVKVALHGLDTRLPDPGQAPVSAPLAKVVVHGLPTDFFFVASFGSGAVGNCFH